MRNTMNGHIGIWSLKAWMLGFCAGTMVLVGAAAGQMLPETTASKNVPLPGLKLPEPVKEVPVKEEKAVTEPASDALPVDLAPRPLGQSASGNSGFKKNASKPVAGLTSSGSPADSSNLMRTGMSLAAVLGLIFALSLGAKYLLKKQGGLNPLAALTGGTNRSPAGILEILGRYPIARGQSVILLKVDTRVLVLSQTAGRLRGGPGSLSTLAEIDHPEDVASLLIKVEQADGRSGSGRFQSMLQTMDKAHAEAEPGYTDVSKRRRQQSAGGDVVELWDERGGDVEETAASFPLVHQPSRGPVQQQQMPSDSFSSLKQRLHALKGESHR